MCDCDICKDIRVFRGHLEQLEEPAKTYFDNLYERYLNVSADLDYYDAVFDGSWPYGKEVLLSASLKYDDSNSVPLPDSERIND